MPVAVALALAGAIGMTYIIGFNRALQVLGNVPYTISSSYVLAVIPLFLLMGAFMHQSGIMQAVYLAASSWFGHLPGRLALSSVVAGSFNSLSEVSPRSNVEAVGSAALPQMVENKYDSRIAVGSIAAGSPITLLIPPSLGLIIYAVITETSIIKLFMAGFIPGVLLSVLFILYVLIAGIINPSLTPKSQVPSAATGFIILLPLAVVIIPIVGAFSGAFTPVEAGAVAAFIAFIVAVIWTLVREKNVFSVIKDSLVQAVNKTCMIMLILIGVIIFSYLLNTSGLSNTLAKTITGLDMSPLSILVLISVVYIFLSCFLEPLSLMVFSLPITFPLIISLKYDPVWFGVIFMLLAGIAMLLPPAHMHLRIFRAIMPEHRLMGMTMGVLPFVILIVIMLFLLVAFPQVATWLPKTIK